MHYKKLLIVSLLPFSVSGKINFNLAVLRDGKLNILPAVILEQKQSPLKVYHDDQTYIEAELVNEKNDEVLIRYTVATKNETGAFIVRGVPQLPVVMTNGLGMTSMQCDGRSETFTLIVAASKTN